MLNHYDRHMSLYQTKHLMHVKGIGLVGLYVPANWTPMQWAVYWFDLLFDSDVVHVRAIA